MTDEERQKLCAALRTQIAESWFYLDSEDAYHGIVRPMGEVAADEIERLAAALREAQREGQLTDKAYADFRQRIADEQGTEFIADD